jgi:hypothetical protein
MKMFLLEAWKEVGAIYSPSVLNIILLLGCWHIVTFFWQLYPNLLVGNYYTAHFQTMYFQFHNSTSYSRTQLMTWT